MKKPEHLGDNFGKSLQSLKKASAEGQSPPQDLEVSPRSGLYLLLRII